MARTYEQIQRQIATLQREAESLRNKEMDGVVARIKVAIEHYGLTAEQLGFGISAGNAKSVKAKRSTGTPSPRGGYADGLGHTWSGRGPRPRWLKDALSAGKTLEELATSGKPAKLGPSAKSSSKKRKAKQSYKDDAGRFWSGFGPQPGWLKEAIASGRKLEEFAA